LHLHSLLALDRLGLFVCGVFQYSLGLAIWVMSSGRSKDSVQKPAGQHSWGSWNPPGDICSSEAKGGYPTLPPGH